MSTMMTADRKGLIDAAYTLFSNYRISAPLDVCHFCCVTKQEENEMLRTPLRELPSDLLSTYNHSATTDSPELEEYKYFLPRFLELAFLDEPPTHSSELTLWRMRYYSQSDFTKDEWQLLRSFCLLYFDWKLNHFSSYAYDDIVCVLLMLCNSKTVSLSELLQKWQATDSIAALQHLHFVVLHAWSTTRPHKLKNPFEEDLPDFSETLRNWIDDPKVGQQFRGYIERYIMEGDKAGEVIEEDVSYLLDLLYDCLPY